MDGPRTGTFSYNTGTAGESAVAITVTDNADSADPYIGNYTGSFTNIDMGSGADNPSGALEAKIILVGSSGNAETFNAIIDILFQDTLYVYSDPLDEVLPEMFK